MRLAWLSAGVAFLAVHLAYALSVCAGFVPACVPYVDGCTSISRAARHGTANLVFKTLMAVDIVLLAFYWRGLAAALRRVRPDAPKRVRAVLMLGLLAAVFLALYAGFLGADGRFYQWLRRYGITVYFAGTVLAEMIAATLLEGLPGLRRAPRAALVLLCAALLGLGLASIPLRAVDDDGSLINVVEWWYALLMIGGYVAVAAALPRR
ncbi:hypothetical protein [Solimonas soli]|uniref:hypothetical protein n=1 Tax=Solimonas soli TaxID=413479 RepID=UPI00047F301B|nr:hypothetical protein [Solimonas soli]